MHLSSTTETNINLGSILHSDSVRAIITGTPLATIASFALQLFFRRPTLNCLDYFEKHVPHLRKFLALEYNKHNLRNQLNLNYRVE